MIRIPDEIYVEAHPASFEARPSEFQILVANTCHAAIGGSRTRFGGAIGTTETTGGAGGMVLDW
jgi:hypothetical protein